MDLRVNASVILLLDPRLQAEIELIESEVANAAQHRHEAPLDDGPEMLLLAVLMWRVGERRLVQNRQTREPFGELRGDHR